MNNSRHAYSAEPLDMVWLESGYQEKILGARSVVQFANFEELNLALFGAVVLKPTRLNGREIAFIRRKLDVSQKALGTILSVSEQTISLWERGNHRIDGATDTLLRVYAIAERPFGAIRTISRKLIRELPALSASLGDFMYIGTFDTSWRFRVEQVRSYASAAAMDQRFVVVTWNAEAPPMKSFGSSRTTKTAHSQELGKVKHMPVREPLMPLGFASAENLNLTTAIHHVRN
jgi:DNA-binding transcriptional regulator YiaG